jgi:hypothetical protein
MNRWLLIGSLACLLTGTTGCLHHNTRGSCDNGGCASGSCPNGACAGGAGAGGGCQNGMCGNGACQGGACGGGGIAGVARGLCGLCGLNGCQGGCRTGCQPGPIGWQQGGLNYSAHLNPGLLGHKAAGALEGRPFTPGPPTGQVGYPYYSVRGPRDFFLDNPPTIGR